MTRRASASQLLLLGARIRTARTHSFQIVFDLSNILLSSVFTREEPNHFRRQLLRQNGVGARTGLALLSNLGRRADEQEWSGSSGDGAGSHHSYFFCCIVFADCGGHLGPRGTARVARVRTAPLPRARLFLDSRLLGMER